MPVAEGTCPRRARSPHHAAPRLERQQAERAARRASCCGMLECRRLHRRSGSARSKSATGISAQCSACRRLHAAPRGSAARPHAELERDHRAQLVGHHRLEQDVEVLLLRLLVVPGHRAAGDDDRRHVGAEAPAQRDDRVDAVAAALQPVVDDQQVGPLGDRIGRRGPCARAGARCRTRRCVRPSPAAAPPGRRARPARPRRRRTCGRPASGRSAPCPAAPGPAGAGARRPAARA